MDRMLALLTESTAPLQQAGSDIPATSLSRSSLRSLVAIATRIDIEIDINNGDNNTSGSTTSKSQNPNKRRKTTTTVPRLEDEKLTMHSFLRQPTPRHISLLHPPGIPTLAHQNTLFQSDTIAIAPGPESTSSTLHKLAKSHAKPKPKPTPKSKARNKSSSKATTGSLSSTPESSDSQNHADGPATTVVQVEGNSASDEAQRQSDEHEMGWHLWRDPYGLASLPYQLRGEPVPWGVCEKCKEENNLRDNVLRGSR